MTSRQHRWGPERRLRLCAAAVLVWVLPTLALAGIGEPSEVMLERLAVHAPQPHDGGYVAGTQFRFRLDSRGGLLYAVTGKGELVEGNVQVMADLIAAATGYGEAIAGPVAEFLEGRAGDLAGVGEVDIAVEEYRLTLDVSGGSHPYRVEFRLTLQELPDEAFPRAHHYLGPEDARFVIREFSDFQCPFCASFASAGLPRIEQLLDRGDVRFEYHHFPLKSIHPNAAPAAEAAECAAETGPEVGFWEYHDALFERQRDWQGLDDPSEYFLDIAGELGIEAAAMASCLDDGRFAGRVEDAYRHAAQELRLTGTPTLFVNGFKVGNFLDPASYLELFELVEAFATEE